MPRPWFLPAVILAAGLAAGPLAARVSADDPVSGAALADSTIVPLATGDWSQVFVGGTLPSARREHCAVFDPVDDRMFLFGGVNVSGLLFDTWQLDLSPTPRWTLLHPTGAPAAGRGLSAIYDPIRRRMIVFGGDTGANGFTNDVWALSLDNPTAWVQLHPLGNPPSGRMYPVGAYDSARDRMIVFGGYPSLNDTWALSLSDPPAWTQLTPTGPLPSGRWGASGVYDPVHDRLVVFSGWPDNTNDTWTLSLPGAPAWLQLSLPGLRPHSLLAASSIFDPARRLMVTYGGLATSANYPEPWQLTLDAATIEWSAIPHTSGVPPLRRFHTAVYRDAQARMLVFGGFDDAGQAFRNDLWEMQLDTGGLPPRIVGFTPPGGPPGTVVTITGVGFTSTSAVEFNSVPASFSIISSAAVAAVVPAGATTGPITVRSGFGGDTSVQSFFVGPVPTLTAVAPDSAKVGETVQILGRDFAAVSRVSFGGSGPASFTVVSSTRIDAVVDAAATNGPITVVNPAGVATSSFAFRLVQPNPRPRLLAVRDVPLDQGDRVVLRWEASDYDVPWNSQVNGYRVWRRAPLDALHSGAAVPLGASTGALAAGSPQTRAEFWESLGEVPAAFFTGYAYVAATLSDSAFAGNPYTAFAVQALTSNPAVFYFSNIDSGYSVDNLAPSVPAAFVASPQAGGIALHWRLNPDADLAAYRIFRGASPSFTPSLANLVATRPDTGYFDSAGSPDNAYKIAAVDVHGNSSAFALATSDRPTATLIGLESLELGDGSVLLHWQAPALPGIAWTLQRMAAGGPWLDRSVVVADADGRVSFEDTGLAPGTEYRYRVQGFVYQAEYVSPEIIVRVPGARLELALEAVGPNPLTASGLAFAITLPDASPARLELVDVSGRRIHSQEVGGLGVGRHVVRPEPAIGLRSGVLFVRVVQGANVATTRVALLR